MSYIEVNYPQQKDAFYALLEQQLALYTGDETNETARLANASAVIAQAFPGANWVGFYLVDGEQVVRDVACFAGHIACDCNTHSEIVVPLWRDGAVWGVLDMDSVEMGAFTEDDRIGLERAVRALG